MSTEEISVRTVVSFNDRNGTLVAYLRFFDLAPFHRAWYKIVGEERAQALEKPRFERDGSFKFHVTAASANEIKKHEIEIPEEFEVTLTLKTIGKVQNDDGREAWFIITDCEDINDWREANGLCRKDLHITLGFDERDIRHLPKGESSKVSDELITNLVAEWIDKHPAQYSVA